MCTPEDKAYLQSYEDEDYWTSSRLMAESEPSQTAFTGLRFRVQGLGYRV